MNKDKIKELIASNFYLDATNVVFIGNTGIEKTHLAVAIRYEVAIKRNSLYFIIFSKLINNLKQAYNEGALEKKIKLYFKYKLLIID